MLSNLANWVDAWVIIIDNAFCIMSQELYMV